MTKGEAEKYARRARADAAEPTREEHAEQALARAFADCHAAQAWSDCQWGVVVADFLALSTREQRLVVATIRLATGAAVPREMDR